MRGRVYSRVGYTRTEVHSLSQEEIKFPAKLSELAKSLLGKLLEKDPNKRYASGPNCT